MHGWGQKSMVERVIGHKERFTYTHTPVLGTVSHTTSTSLTEQTYNIHKNETFLTEYTHTTIGRTFSHTNFLSLTEYTHAPVVRNIQSYNFNVIN